MPIDPIYLGGTAGLIAALVYGIKRLWESHLAAIEDLQKDRDYWRAMALRTLGVAEKVAKDA